MRSVKSLLYKVFSLLPFRCALGSAGKNCKIKIPCLITAPQSLHLDENTFIRMGCKILNTPDEHVHIKRYTVISTNCTIVTNNHKSRVGVPQCLLGTSHINDVSKDLTIGEDVFVGTNVTILSNGDIGRGCVIGAGSVVTRPLPPYAVAAGCPAKIIGCKFTIDQILKHEEKLYPEEQRMSKLELEKIFELNYKDLKTYGDDAPFTSQEEHALLIAKKGRNFIEPPHGALTFQ